MVVCKRMSKWKKTIMFGRMVMHKRKNLNKRGPYMLVEWLCATKRNKSMRTIILTNKRINERGPMFRLFVLGVTQGNENAVWVRGFIFLFLVLIKGIRRYSESNIPLPQPSGGKLLLRPSVSYNKLLGSGVSRALSSIYDGAFLRK